MANGDNAMKRVADGIYRRNGRLLVLIYNPDKGKTGGRDYHTLGKCSCGVTHPGGGLSATSREALTAARALKGELEGKKANGGGELMIGDWAGRWEAGEAGEEWAQGRWLIVRPRKAESTNIHNDGRVRSFARAFAGRSMASVTEEEAQVFVLSNPHTYKEIHAMYNDAVALKLVDRNPFAGLKVPSRAGRKDIVVLTDVELGQLTGIAKAVHGEGYGELFAAMILTAAWTGLRPSELFLLSLEESDNLNFVDLRAGVVHVDWQLGAKTGKVGRPKKESQREVILLPAAEDALRAIEDRQEPGLPLFTTRRGKPFNQRTHFYYWDPVRAAFAAALPAGHHIRQRATDTGEPGNLDFYELRHFFGTKLAHPPAGVTPASPYEIAAMMGHKDGGQLAMERYIHVHADVAQKSIRNAWRKAS